MSSYIKGNFRKSIFKSDKGYVIGLFKVRETNDKTLEEYVNQTITFTGYFHELNEDDTYILYGESVNHPRYGFQFQTERYERLKPKGKDAIVEFLSSDLFPGVGEKLAKSIADVLGDNAIDKILEDESCLYLVPKLSETKVKKIAFNLKKYEASHQVISRLIDLDFSMREALSIYNEYKINTMKIIDSNIYQICYNLQDISFLKIDKVAKNLHIALDDERRVKAAVLYVMKILIYKNGDSYLKKDFIISNVNKFLNISYDDYDKIFEKLEDMDYIVIDGDDYYLYDIWNAEANITERLYDMSLKKHKEYKNLPNLLVELENINNIKYNDEQKEAIIKALENNILIITGGPGTGKSATSSVVK